MSGSKPKYPGLNPIPPHFVGEHAPIAKIVEEECIACDRCPPICFFDALFMERREGHPYGRVAVVVEKNCTGCGLCFEACPVDAILWVPESRLRPFVSSPLDPTEQEPPRESY